MIEDQDSLYPLADWRYEVANGDTRLGYAEWVRACRERDDDEPLTCRHCGSDLPKGVTPPGQPDCPSCGRDN